MVPAPNESSIKIVRAAESNELVALKVMPEPLAPPRSAQSDMGRKQRPPRRPCPEPAPLLWLFSSRCETGQLVFPNKSEPTSMVLGDLICAFISAALGPGTITPATARSHARAYCCERKRINVK